MLFRSLIPGSLLFLAPLSSALPQASTDGFRWQGSLAAGKTIEIIGVNGDIEAEGTTGRQVEVTASKRARKSDLSTVTFEVVEHADGITICAMYPATRQGPNECKPGNKGRMNTSKNDVEVEWSVKVPAGVRLTGRTVNGRIDARNLTAPAEARTVNGSISIETAAWADASTVNGSIVARLGAADWSGEIEFSTVNGGVSLSLPASTSARVDASNVNGGMRTDFPLTIQGRWGPHRMSGTIGQGGRDLSLSTVNGTLELRKH